MAFHTRQQAERLLAGLDLPTDAGKILGSPRYWSERFCLLYLERCDDVLYEEPRPGLQMAWMAPTLARWIPVEHCRGGRRRKRELEVRALAVLGGAKRRLGRLLEAEEHYAAALRIGRSAKISETEAANLLLRLSILRADQRRIDEALSLTDRAIATYRSGGGEDFRHDLGLACSIRAIVHLEAEQSLEAIHDLLEALNLLDPERSERYYFSAMHNLGYALVRKSCESHDLGFALAHLRQAQLALGPGRHNLAHFKLGWIEGLIREKRGELLHAEDLFLEARQGLIDLEAPFEVALVSLELSILYRDQQRYGELRSLAGETYRIFKALSAEDEASAVLQLWYEAVMAENLTDEILGSVRAILQHHVRPAA